jgi:1-acyl-sn-glycerol-3-phosphate acyltransferase
MIQHLSSLPLISKLVLHAMQGRATLTRDFAAASVEAKAGHVHRWSRALLEKIWVELEVQGARKTAGPVLYVCNHISWLDIFVINGWQSAVFVSKAEVANWPLIGPLVSGAGTIFIERERMRDALKVVGDLTQSLREGHTAAIFPEGTTSAGDTLLPFHANLIEAAIAAQVPLQPLALSYHAADGSRSFAASYIGEMTLLDSLTRLAGEAPITARLQVLDPIFPTDRRSASKAARAQIAQALDLS